MIKLVLKTPDPAVRPKDKTVTLWNADCWNIASLVFRAGNEVLKSKSGRSVSGIGPDDKSTFKKELEGIIARIDAMDEIYYPATHNDVVYEALLADYSHPQIVKLVTVPEDHEPGPE